MRLALRRPGLMLALWLYLAGSVCFAAGTIATMLQR